MGLSIEVKGKAVGVELADRGACQCEAPTFNYLPEEKIFECQDEECLETAPARYVYGGKTFADFAKLEAAISKPKKVHKGEIVESEHAGKGIRELKDTLRDLAQRTYEAEKVICALAFETGELLTVIKARSEKGKFETIVKQTCPFSIRTAQQYMKLYRLWKDSRGAVAALSNLSLALKGPESKKSQGNKPKSKGKSPRKSNADGADLLENQPIDSVGEAGKLVARVQNSSDTIRHKAVGEIAAFDPGVAITRALEAKEIDCELKAKHAKALATVAATLPEAKMVSVALSIIDQLSPAGKVRIIQRIYTGNKSDIPEELLIELSRRANLYLPKLGRARKDKPGSLEDVMKYAKHLVDTNERADATKYAKKFFDHYTSADWMIKDGIPVQDWKHRLKVFCGMLGGETVQDRRVDVATTTSSSNIAKRRQEIAEEKARKAAEVG